ncbi:hypothetical protein HDU96_006601 [Phlyctochytrium bullatum]|nr:hypothetical protein HDU96_006601 [Phlyctochytrium bullatum]
MGPDPSSTSPELSEGHILSTMIKLTTLLLLILPLLTVLIPLSSAEIVADLYRGPIEDVLDDDAEFPVKANPVKFPTPEDPDAAEKPAKKSAKAPKNPKALLEAIRQHREEAQAKAIAAAEAPTKPYYPVAPPGTQVIAVGDLHGDFKNTVRVLQMAGIIDKNLAWAAPAGTTFVQTGDVVDRGDDTILLYQLLANLTAQAPAKGGKVVRTLGNHELMNMGGDWRYVTDGDIKTFGSRKKRAEAFAPTGWIGKQLMELPVVAQVDDTIFVHGGVHPMWKDLGIDGINEAAKQSMLNGKFFDNGVLGGEGVLWYRGYAQEHEGFVCGKLVNTLIALRAKRMVMGHTPQMNGRILSRCNHMALIVDVGISSAYGGNCAALKIEGERVTGIYCDREHDNFTPSKK